MGLLAAVGISVFLALVHGFASITNKGNQIVSGVAINFVAVGLTGLLGQSWFHQGGRTPQLSRAERFNPIELPFQETIGSIPYVGTVYTELISGHSLLAYFAFAMVPITWWILFRTRFGLRLAGSG